MSEAVRQLCMLAAHEHSDDKLANLVEEIYRLVSKSGPSDREAAALGVDALKPRQS